jgi:flagellar M-ring protein FliF
MATQAAGSNLVTQLNNLTQLTLVRQIFLMLIAAGAVALGVSVVLWSRGNNYTVLYSNLGTQDISELSQALESAQLKYRIEPGSGYLSVPEENLQEVRMHLASLGLPRSTGNGYDILSEQSSLGTSNFIEQARYNRALEQELVKTIKLLRGVRDVRVHVSIPKQSSFLRSSSRPGASVMLDLIGTGAVSDTQIAGIAHLVASSVAGLDSADVSIVDQKGNLLSKAGGSDPFGGGTEQLKYTRSLEQEYTQRIVDILTPIVGPENIRAQVTADLDFTLIETTEESYDPASVVVRSEQTQEENRESAAPLPGALAATPPVDAEGAVVPATASSSGQSRVNATRNYEIDKSTSHIRRVPGDIRRLSVAVLVDINAAQLAALDPALAAPAIDPAEQAAKLERITQLVKDSIGYDAERGDSVNIVAERFSLPVVEEPPPIIQEIWESAWVPSALKQLAASIVVLMLIFAVFKPALKSVLAPIEPKELPRPTGSSYSAQPVSIAAGGSDGSEHAKQLPTRSVFDENLSMAQNLVNNEPARAARMIKEWVASD